MKRIIALTLMMFVLLTAWAEVRVSTADAFKTEIEKDPSAYIRLTADIDITTIGTISKTFRGTIDGEGTKVINGTTKTVYFSLHGGEGKYRVSHPIFKMIEGATIKNLLIRNFRIEWDDDEIGAVAYTAKNSKFNNVIVSEVSIFNDDDEAGAIVGKAENCDFRNVRGMGNDITVDGTHAGGFVGISYNSVYCNCSNSAYSTVYADGSWGNAYAGGFVGESSSDQFVFCVNLASVGALDDRVGGLVGYSTRSIFTNCTNSGLIIQCKEKNFLAYTGQLKQGLANRMAELTDELQGYYDKQDFDLAAGFVSFIGTIGLSATAFGVELCLLTFASAGVGAFALTIIAAATGISVTLINAISAEIGAHDEMGGICGTCEGSIFDACSNFGRLMCIDCYVGGIVGLMRDRPTASKITNCLNAGHIQGYERVGGIFGECPPAHVVTHCLNVGEVSVPSDGRCDPIGNVNYDLDGNLSQNYYKSTKNAGNASARIPVNTDQLENGTVAGLLNDGATGENALWHQDIEGGKDKYPVPDPSHAPANPQKHDDVFVVSSVEDLDALRTAVNSGSKNNYIVYVSADIDYSGKIWEPIGTSTHPFSGICYGNGHTISNLNTVNDKTKEGVGFFGNVGVNTEIQAINIGPGNIVGGTGVGAVIGCYNQTAPRKGFIRVIGCSNAATITGKYNCGGIIGAVSSSPLIQLTLDNCYNTGTIHGDNTNEGYSAALCGYSSRNVLVTSCWNSGAVTGYQENMGFVHADKSTYLNIHNCYNAENLKELLQTGKDIESFSPDEARNGILCFNLNGGSNDASVGLPWEQDITSGAIYPTYIDYSDTKKAVYTSREIRNNYGTVVLPYAVKSDDYIRYYVLSSADGTRLNFAPVDTLEAGTPAIFRVVKADTTYTFISGTENFSYDSPVTAEKSGWKMNGNLSIDNEVIDDTDVLKKIYYISNGEIKNATTQLTVAPFRAYLEGPARQEGTEVHAFDITFDDDSEATGLQFVPVKNNDDGTVSLGLFNLAGQRLDEPQPGINIINGKKVYRK